MIITPIREAAPPNGHPYLEPLHPIKKFTVMESIWGKFIVCRNAQYHPEYMIKHGRTIHPAENETLATIISVLPDECVIVDAGANAGAFCVPMSIAAKKKNGMVYAFEVQKKLYQALCGTVVLNDFDNLEILNFALSDKNEVLRIPRVNYDVPQDYGIVSLANQEKINNQVHDLVDAITIDSLELDRLDLFKIDVEGMELNVLQGGIETIKKHRPYFWVEFYCSDTTKLKEWFENLGDYTIYQVTGADILCVPNEKISSTDLKINCPIFNK